METLQEKGVVTKLGEKAIEAAKRNGTWDTPKREPITDKQIEEFTEKLVGISPAYENFCKMPPSVRLSYTGRYLSFKSEEARQRDLAKIIDRLNINLNLCS